MKKLLALVCILSISIIRCHSADINVARSQSVLDSHLKKSNYKLGEIDYSLSEKELFYKGLILLNIDYDILTAERIFRYLATKYPTNSEYLYCAGRAAFFVGEYNYFPNIRDSYDIAFDNFEKALKLDPKTKYYMLMKSYTLGRIGLFIRREKGGLLSGSKELYASMALIDEILEVEDIWSLDANYMDVILARGNVEEEALLTRGEVLKGMPGILGGSEDMAIRIYKYVAKKRPDNMRAHLLLGKYYHSKGKQKLAIEEYAKVQRIFDSGKAPQSPEVDQMMAFLPRNLGNVYWAQGKYKKAFRQFKLNVKRRPTSSSGHEWMGHYYKRIGKKEKAIRSYKKAVYYSKWNSSARDNLAQLQKK